MRQGLKLTHKLRLLNDGLTPLPVYGLGADLFHPSPDLNGTAGQLKGIETGLLLEAKKPLERTPHFFEPGVGECVNATGLSELQF